MNQARVKARFHPRPNSVNALMEVGMQNTALRGGGPFDRLRYDLPGCPTLRIPPKVKRYSFICLPMLIGALFGNIVLADLPSPRLTTLTPCGIQRGTTVDVTLGGTDLDGLTGLYFSGSGLKVDSVEGTKVKITADANAPLGLVDVRAVGTWGVSNVRRFMVTDLEEVAEKEPNNLREQPNRVPFNCAITGRSDARSDVDYFAFTVSKGQSVLIDCFAERIDSRMSPVLTLFAPDGRREKVELAGTGKDPHFIFTARTDGEHIVRVHDLTYDGSGEYFYRLLVHDRPTALTAFPPVVSTTGPAEVALLGHRLEQAVQPQLPENFHTSTMLDASVLLRPYQVVLDAFTVRPVVNGNERSPVLIGLTDLPVQVEQEPNSRQNEATKVTLPAEIVGRIDSDGDRDYFRFQAKKGSSIPLKVLAERLGSPVDLAVVLQRIVSENPLKTADVGEFDDFTANVGRTKFTTSSHDPVATLNIPEDGDYLLEVYDRFSGVRAGLRSVYRLQVGASKPDFHVAIVPSNEDNFSSVVVRQGGTAYAQVFAVREGGFNGEIRVEATGLPEGITAPPVVIGPGMVEAPLVFTASEDAADFTGPIQILCTADIGSSPVTRVARAGEIVWSGPANAPKASRLTQEFVLACRPKGVYRLNAEPAQVTCSQGSQLTLALKLARHWPEFTQPLADITALHLPPNVENQKVTIGEKQTDGHLHLFIKNNVPIGTYSFIVAGTGKVAFTKTPEDPKAKKADVTIADPSLPITVTIVPQQVEVAVEPATPTIKPGEKTTVKVTLKRLNNYTGSVALSLTVPPGAEGVTATSVDVPADQSQATMEIACAADVPPGDKAFVTVRATATVQGKAVASDARLTIKVAK